MAVATSVSMARQHSMRMLESRCRLGAWALPRQTCIQQAVPVPGVARPIHVQFASTEADWRQAFQLVTDNYQARGYEPFDLGKVRFSPYHALPDTVVLVARAEGRVVATFSLVADNHLLGLPLESLYQSEVRGLRRQGRHIFETTSLADRDLSPREFVQVFLTMMQLAWQYGLACGAETNVITVSPRHSDFYTRMLGYAPLGPRRAYDRVQGHLAEAFFLNPGLMCVKVPAVHQRLFSKRLGPEALRPPRMPADLVRHCAAHSSQTDSRLVEEVLRYVETYGSPRRW
jgi:hypothetical protein